VPVAATTSPARTHIEFLAQSVSFVSDDDGWVLGAATCSTGWCTVLLHTTDRGGHWKTVAALPGPFNESRADGVNELRFADVRNGFAFGPGLWVTHDGAEHWNEVHLRGGVLALATTDRAAYVLVAPCWPFTRPCTTPATLYRSRVGSNTWRRVLNVASVQGGQLALHGSAVYFLAETARWYLLASPNGTTFTRFGDPCRAARSGVGNSPTSIAVSPAGRLAVVCSGAYVAGGSEVKQVYVSANGDKTYREVGEPPSEGDAGGELVAPGDTTLLMTALSGAGFVFRTTGTDRTWTTPLSSDDGGAGFYDLGFSDATDGAVIHAPAQIAETITANPPAHLGTLYLTNDGGRSWYPLSVNA